MGYGGCGREMRGDEYGNISDDDSSSSSPSVHEETREEYLKRKEHADRYGDCVNCGREVLKDNTYCSNCGKKWREQAPQRKVYSTCPNGHGYSNGEYCGTCGAKLIEKVEWE